MFLEWMKVEAIYVKYVKQRECLVVVKNYSARKAWPEPRDPHLNNNTRLCPLTDQNARAIEPV